MADAVDRDDVLDDDLTGELPDDELAHLEPQDGDAPDGLPDDRQPDDAQPHGAEPDDAAVDDELVTDEVVHDLPPAEHLHHKVMAGIPPPGTTQRDDGSAAAYRARRTLGIRVELRRQLTRRRTQISLGFLVLLPFLLVAAFSFGSGNSRAGAPGLVDLATEGAGNFTVFTLFVSFGFLLVVVVALFAGDTVASEASWSSLRYLLAVPIPRAHLLRRKLIVALLYCVFSLVLLPTVAFIAGGVFFGWAPLRSPIGDTISGGALVWHLVVAVAYIAVTLLFVAALAFLLGVLTDAPLGAVGGAVMLVIVSNILDAVTALGSFRQVLPTHYGLAWIDVLSPDIIWDSMIRGTLWSVGYSAVLFAYAWWHFDRKDVTS